MRRGWPILGLAGLAAILYSWHSAGDIAYLDPDPHLKRLWLLVGIGLLWLAFGVLPAYPLTAFTFIPTTDSLKTIRWLLFGLGAGMLVFLGVVGPKWWLPSPNQQLLLFFGGMACMVYACVPSGGLQRAWDHLKQSWQTQRWEWLLVMGLTLVGFAVRVYKLETLFPLPYTDESPYLRGMRRMYEGESRFLANYVHNAAVYLFSQHNALWFYLFGENLFAARFTSVLMGSLAIPSVYLAARRMMNWQAGLFAALFLIGQPVHVQFSRYAANNIVDPTIGLWAVLALWSAARYGGLWRWALSGALLGWSQYYYTGSALWLVLIPLWLGITILRQPVLFKGWAKGLAVFGMIFILLMLPRVVWYWVDPFDQTTAHFEEVAIWRVHDRAEVGRLMDEQVTPSLRAFVDQTDRWPHFEPAPNSVSALNQRLGLLLFALGLAFIGRYALHPAALLVVLWVLLTIFLGGVLTATPPSFARYVTVTLSMALMAGLGMAGIGQLSGKQWSLLPILGVALLAMGYDLHYSLVEHPQHYLSKMAPEYWLSETLSRASREAQAEGQTVYWLVNGDPFYNPRYWESYQFYTGLDMRPYIIEDADITAFLAQLDRASHPVTLFVRPQEEGMSDFLRVIQAAYPDATYQQLTPPQEYESVQGLEGFIQVSIPQPTSN